MIRGAVPEGMPYRLGIESVQSVEELKGTLLTNTPILFFVKKEDMGVLRRDLLSVLERKDVCRMQLFFMFDDDVNVEQMTRFISDLGVGKPQIVKDMDDELVMKYLQNYPMTEYIREVIRIMEEEISKISQILEMENRESEIANKDIHNRIERLENEAPCIKVGEHGLHGTR